MASSSRFAPGWAWLSWLVALILIPLWIHVDHVGWDVAIYRNAIVSLQAGHDPYSDAMAEQEAFHRTLALHPNAHTPFSYVYSPITLPVLRLIGALPVWLSGIGYWAVYAASVAAILWVGTQFLEPGERTAFGLLASAAIFLPGMCLHDAVLSGNVAFILYALVLLGSMAGWRSGRWRWFYAAVLLASCVKAPLLCLAAIPVFSAKRQWLPAAATVTTGVALFALQSLIWPTLFRHYLQAVELQFSYNRDFGCSPAGLFSSILVDHGIPYSPASSIFYLAYAIPLLALLFYLSRKFFAGRFSFQRWMPLLLVGVILLNPRIMQYDTAPLTLPLAVIAWRFLHRWRNTPAALLGMIALFGTANFFASQDLNHWKLVEGYLLLALFAAGCWDLLNGRPLPIANTVTLSPSFPPSATIN